MINDALALVETLALGFERALVEVKILDGAPGRYDIAQHALAPLASSIDVEMQTMLTRRREVEVSDPWRFGLLLAFLEDQIVVSVLDESGGEVKAEVSRFQFFQYMGFWPDREYVEWANERTGKEYTTWMNWKRAAKVCLLSTVGQAYVRRAGLTTTAFIEQVSMDKALRACSKMARGEIMPHQLDVLVDKDKSCETMRHALRSTAVEWEEVQEQQEQKDAEWAAKGDEKAKVDFDPATRVLRLGKRTNGEWVTFTIARLPVPTDPLVEELQVKLIAMAKKEV